MIDAGAAALEAADSRDPEAVLAVGEEVYLACDRCHGLYWVRDADRGRIRDTLEASGRIDRPTFEQVGLSLHLVPTIQRAAGCCWRSAMLS